ncbi:MAG: hypothetical protein D6812_18035 [Deltaproteobacteria bacterium]|nr:MAG: hypothetical protein D6812_18035 [Deltaproteobacteria bacterium]
MGEFSVRRGGMMSAGDTIEIGELRCNLAATLACGQSFRWGSYTASGFQGAFPDEGGRWYGVVADAMIEITPLGGGRLRITASRAKIGGRPLASFVRWLFRAEEADLAKEAELEHFARHDPVFGEAYRTMAGLRLMRMAPFECMMTFILSQNNHVVRIARTLEAIARRFGRKGVWRSKCFHAFPRFAALTIPSIPEESVFRELGAGFRARYITATLRTFVERGTTPEASLAALASLDTSDVAAALTTFPGIGPKVAHCILLFAFDRLEAVPVDTHILRMTRAAYGLDLASHEIRTFYLERFGALAGFVQHYFFAYSRYRHNRRFRELVDREGAGIRS